MVALRGRLAKKTQLVEAIDKLRVEEGCLPYTMATRELMFRDYADVQLENSLKQIQERLKDKKKYLRTEIVTMCDQLGEAPQYPDDTLPSAQALHAEWRKKLAAKNHLIDELNDVLEELGRCLYTDDLRIRALRKTSTAELERFFKQLQGELLKKKEALLKSITERGRHDVTYNIDMTLEQLEQIDEELKKTPPVKVTVTASLPDDINDEDLTVELTEAQVITRADETLKTLLAFGNDTQVRITPPRPSSLNTPFSLFSTKPASSLTI